MQLEIGGGGFIFLENIFERHLDDAAPLAQAHQGFVNGDARNPSGETSAALKLVQIAMSLEERLLLSILGILLIPGDAEGQTKGALLAILNSLRAHHRFVFVFLTKSCAWTIHNSPRERTLTRDHLSNRPVGGVATHLGGQAEL